MPSREVPACSGILSRRGRCVVLRRRAFEAHHFGDWQELRGVSALLGPRHLGSFRPFSPRSSGSAPTPPLARPTRSALLALLALLRIRLQPCLPVRNTLMTTRPRNTADAGAPRAQPSSAGTSRTACTRPSSRSMRATTSISTSRRTRSMFSLSRAEEVRIILPLAIISSLTRLASLASAPHSQHCRPRIYGGV